MGAFLMQCTRQVQPKTENKKQERVNGSDRIKKTKRQRYVPELTKKPSLYKSYTDQEKNKAKYKPDDFLKGGVVKMVLCMRDLVASAPIYVVR
jgi:hypothetical protein